MNGENNQRKDSAIKTLAIIGFTATIVLGVWLAVQVVQLAPSAFSSLASLSESVYGKPNPDEINVVTSKSVVNNAETFTLRWSKVDRPGEYRFTYACTQGVDVLIKNNNGDMVPAACDQPFTLSTSGETQIQVKSDVLRFIDVDYTVTFSDAGEREVAIADSDKFTVVNATIPQGGIVAGAEDDNNEVATETEEKEEMPTPTTPVVTTPTAPSTPAPAPQPQYEFTYELPVSNPNGFVDLKANYLGVGELNSSNVFIPRATIDNDTRGALRFSVTNIGTKTSNEWTYEVDMPNGSTYESPKQTGLKPNETATIVLGFDTTETGTKAIKGDVKVANDRSNTNNDFSWSVKVTD
jgi:hypothetical protein